MLLACQDDLCSLRVPKVGRVPSTTLGRVPCKCSLQVFSLRGLLSDLRGVVGDLRPSQSCRLGLRTSLPVCLLINNILMLSEF